MSISNNLSSLFVDVWRNVATQSLFPLLKLSDNVLSKKKRTVIYLEESPQRGSFFQRHIAELYCYFSAFNNTPGPPPYLWPVYMAK